MNKAINLSIGAGLVIVVCLTIIIIFDPFGWIHSDKEDNENTYFLNNSELDRYSDLTDDNRKVNPYDRLMIQAINEIDRKNFYEALSLLAEADMYTDNSKTKEEIEETYNDALIKLAKQDERKGLSRDYSNLLLENRRAIREGKIYDDIDRTINSAIFRSEALKQYAEALDLLFIADQMYPNPKQQILISNLYSSILDKLIEKDKSQNIKREYMTLSDRRKKINDALYNDKKNIYQENPLANLDLDNQETLLSSVDDNQDTNSLNKENPQSNKTGNNKTNIDNTRKETETEDDKEKVEYKTEKDKTHIQKPINDDKTKPEPEKDDKQIKIDQKEPIIKSDDEKDKTNPADSPSNVDKAIKEGRLEDAISMLEEELKSGKNDIDIILKLIEVYGLMGKLDETSDYVKELLKSKNTNLDKLKKLADSYYNNDLFSIAYEFYNLYKQKNTFDYEVLYKMSYIELSNKQLDKAIQRLTTIINHKAGLDRDILKDSYYLMGLAMEMKGLSTNSLGYYSEAIKIDKNYIKPMIQMGKVYYKLGTKKTRTNQFSKAKDILNQALKVDSDNYSTLLWLGKTEEKLGNIENAITMYRKATQVKPDDYQSRVLLADALLQVGKANESVSQFEIAFLAKSIGGNEGLILLEYAEALRKSGRYQDSINIYNQAFNTDVDKDLIYKGLSEVSFMEKKYKESIDYLEKAIDINGNNPIYYTNIAIAYNIIGQLDKAEKYYKIALNKDKDNQFIIEELASLYITKGEYDKGIKLLETIINDGKESADLLYFLGDAYIKAGRESKAINVFNKLLNEYPDYNNTKVVMEQLEILSQ
jgi:tetratricopeptide (TPR) repeat protein